MKKIIRSLAWQDQSEKAAVTENYKSVKLERFLNLRTAEREILEYQLEFYQRTGEAPQGKNVLDNFELAKNTDAIVLVEEAQQGQAYFTASFKDAQELEIEEQAAQNLTSVCKTAVKIATQGHTFGKTTVKGVDEAVSYLFSSAQTKPPPDDSKIKASMRDGQAALDALYQERKNNPHNTYGILTGYGLFDSSTAGLRKKQFYLHAGFGGHLKSTHMMNMIVNAAVDGGYNPLLFTSEMPAEDVKMMMIAIHSANPKFASVARPISAFRYLLGSLTPAEEAFANDVHNDLVTNPNHGLIRVIDSSEFTTWGSVQQRTIREHAENEVDELWCDYPTRLPIDAKYRGMEIRAARNETLADCKRFAMAFDNGNGIPVCAPFQINRTGYLHALANEGRMNKTALGDYNAAEKEADVITYIFYDKEEVATSEPKIGILKSRWGAMGHDPVSVYIEPDSRRIVDMTAGMTVQAGYAPTSSGADAGDQVEL